MAIDVSVRVVMEDEFVEETAWAFERPATPNNGVAFGSVKVGFPSRHAKDEFVCVVSASPQQYSDALVRFARQTDKRTSWLR